VDDAVGTQLAELHRELARIDPNFATLVIAKRVLGGSGAVMPAGSRLVYDRDGAVAETFGAEPGSLYLLRPDLHIAGRWRELVPEEVVAQLKRALGLAP
jgi:3-(3-hydroxy-phenyl)propionate hydroxylase